MTISLHDELLHDLGSIETLTNQNSDRNQQFSDALEAARTGH